EAQSDEKSADSPAAPPANPDHGPKTPSPATGPGNCEPPSLPAPEANIPASSRNGAVPHMAIKRSLSPDGRIDALSIEIDFAVTERAREQWQAKACKLITLKEGIARQYLERYRGVPRPPATNGSTASPNGAGAPTDAGQPQPAKLVEIGQTKNGKLY